MNHVSLIGNLTDDPSHDAESGRTTFTLAVNERYRDENGEWQQSKSNFIPVVGWNRLGQNANESLRKGDRVVVTGSLRIRSANEAAEGEEPAYRTYVDVVAESIGPSLEFSSAQPVEAVA